MPRPQRRMLFIDRNVQGALILRAGYYWGFCLLVVVLMWSCWIALFDRPATSTVLVQKVATQLFPALLASLLIVPIVLVDCLRLTNRFAGPIFRIKRTMRQLIENGNAEPVLLRQGDYWFDFAEQFNKLVEKYMAQNVSSRENDTTLNDDHEK